MKKTELILLAIYLLLLILDDYLSFSTTALVYILPVFIIGWLIYSFKQENKKLNLPFIMSLYYKSLAFTALIFINYNYPGKDWVTLFAIFVLIAYSIYTFLKKAPNKSMMVEYMYFNVVILSFLFLEKFF